MSSNNRASVADNNPLKGFATKPAAEPEQVNEPAPQAKTSTKRKKPVRAGHRQTTVILPTEQLNWLGEAALRSTRDNGIVTNKTTIIKALVDVAITVGLDLSGIQEEEEISKRLIEAVKSKR